MPPGEQTTVEWLNKLIEHISISSAVTTAFFVTSSSLLFGPVIVPTLIEPLDSAYRTVALILFFYSGSLLAFWSIKTFRKPAKDVAWKTVGRIRERNLTDDEIKLLKWIANQGIHRISLGHLIGKVTGKEKLEVMSWAKSLEAKALIRSEKYDETRVWLTQRGRVKAFELLSQG